MLTKCIKTLVYIVISYGFVHSGFAAGKLPVFVSIVPQKFFVQQIGGNLVETRVMVQPGASPATYEPRPRQMAALAGSAVYFAIGVPFEKAWLPKIAATNPGMQVVHTDQGITKLRMADHDHHDEKAAKKPAMTDSHDHHREEIPDPHIWLSPPLVKMQARTILTTLQALDPDNQDFYAANYAQFTAAIDRLDSELREIFAGKQGARFMVFHPSWNYFASTYALRQVPIEIEGKNPKPAQLQKLIVQAREKEISVIFVQPQFSTRNAALVAREIGGQVAFADPLAADWMDNLRRVAAKFKMAAK